MFHGAFSTVPGKRQRLLERQSLGIDSPITFCQAILVGLIEATFAAGLLRATSWEGIFNTSQFLVYLCTITWFSGIFVPERIDLFPTFQSWILPGSVPPNVPLMISYGPSVSWRNCDVVGTFERGKIGKKNNQGASVDVLCMWLLVGFLWKCLYVIYLSIYIYMYIHQIHNIYIYCFLWSLDNPETGDIQQNPSFHCDEKIFICFASLRSWKSDGRGAPTCQVSRSLRWRVTVLFFCWELTY